jgi:hypothetical protein
METKVTIMFARFAAAVHSAPLDRALIDGADPQSSPRLAARATALTSVRHRASVADGIERWLRALEQPAPRRRVVPARRATATSAAALGELAARLRADDAAPARAVALARRLVCDGAASPAYDRDPAALQRGVAEARAAFAQATRIGTSYRSPDGAWVHGRRDG